MCRTFFMGKLVLGRRGILPARNDTMLSSFLEVMTFFMGGQDATPSQCLLAQCEVLNV